MKGMYNIESNINGRGITVKFNYPNVYKMVSWIIYDRFFYCQH